jgi:sugar phosphate isomerase/epimerase
VTRIGISGGQLRHLDMAQILSKTDEFGADAVEPHWGVNISGLQEVDHVKRLLASSRKFVDVLNTDLLWSPAELQDLPQLHAKLNECLEAAERFGSRFMLVHCACPPRESLDDPVAKAELSRYLDALRPCAAACRERGINLVVENYFGTLLGSPQATLRLLQEGEPLGLRLAFDPSNYYNSGAEPYPLAYQLLKEYVAVLHVKNSARYDNSIYAPDVKVAERAMPVVFLPLGKGAVNWEGLCDELLRTGFDGPMTIEPNTALKHLDATFAANVRYLKAKGFGNHA